MRHDKYSIKKCGGGGGGGGLILYIFNAAEYKFSILRNIYVLYLLLFVDNIVVCIALYTQINI